MVLLDVLGRRWVLRILWELREHKAATFRELQASCDSMSPNVLNSRLKDLRSYGLVDVREEGGYVLTDDGLVLISLLLPISSWAKSWARQHGLGEYAELRDELLESKSTKHRPPRGAR